MLLSSVPISAIRAFEAAARTGSFRDAANELHLTPSAVSHAIRKLESTMSTTLFERSARSVRLTPAGENLMRHAGAAFDNLRRGMEEVTGRGPQLLQVHCAPSFAAQWLAFRLAQFLAAEPKLEVRLAASTEYARFSNDDFDVDVVYGQPKGEGIEIIPLGEETVTPLCTLDIAKRIRKPKDLFGQVLIRSEVKRVQWHQWFAANGLESPAIHVCVSTAASLPSQWLRAVLAWLSNRPGLRSVKLRQENWSPHSRAVQSMFATLAIISLFRAPADSDARCAPLPSGSRQSFPRPRASPKSSVRSIVDKSDCGT